VYKNPERVSFLVNKGTGSAAEMFLLEAKQSKKVKLYGTNSSGAVDYTEYVKILMPCKFYTLYYPACKSLRLPDYPLDNIGIKPDVEIPADTADWIDYVKKYKD
jgi:C-terminal processing protease CtpA/Prc